jgi:hypothetical protein
MPLPSCMMPDGGDCCPEYHSLTKENERLRAALKDLIDWADEYRYGDKCPTYDAIYPARVALQSHSSSSSNSLDGNS